MSDFDTWYDRLSTTSALPAPAPSGQLRRELLLRRLALGALVLLLAAGLSGRLGVHRAETTAAGTLVVLVVFLSYVTYRWKDTRSIFQGAPVLVVADGEFLDEALRSERLTTEEILEAARIEGIEDIGDIRYAVLKTSGKMSFIRG